MSEPKDTGDLLEVPEDQQLDEDPTDADGSAEHVALVDLDHPGPDDDLEDVYDDPGEVVEESLG